MTIAELDERMTPVEFFAWHEYYLQEPFGSRTHHLMQAQISALLFNVNRGEKTEPLTLYDFDLFEDSDSREGRYLAEESAWRRKMIASAESHNASIKSKTRK